MKLSTKKLIIIAALCVTSFACKGMEKEAAHVEEVRVLYYKDNLIDNVQTETIEPYSIYLMPLPLENPRNKKTSPDSLKKAIILAQQITKPQQPINLDGAYTIPIPAKNPKSDGHKEQSASDSAKKESSWAQRINMQPPIKQDLNKEKSIKAASNLLVVLNKPKPSSGEEQKAPTRNLSLIPNLQGFSPEVFTPPAPDLSKLLLLEECKSS